MTIMPGSSGHVHRWNNVEHVCSGDPGEHAYHERMDSLYAGQAVGHEGL